MTRDLWLLFTQVVLNAPKEVQLQLHENGDVELQSLVIHHSTVYPEKSLLRYNIVNRNVSLITKQDIQQPAISLTKMYIFIAR